MGAVCDRGDRGGRREGQEDEGEEGQGKKQVEAWACTIKGSLGELACLLLGSQDLHHVHCASRKRATLSSAPAARYETHIVPFVVMK